MMTSHGVTTGAWLISATLMKGAHIEPSWDPRGLFSDSLKMRSLMDTLGPEATREPCTRHYSRALHRGNPPFPLDFWLYGTFRMPFSSSQNSGASMR
eukprot:scaffold160887_cov32-Tisochrysis_lutea.AAC.2